MIVEDSKNAVKHGMVDASDSDVEREEGMDNEVDQEVNLGSEEGS